MRRRVPVLWMALLLTLSIPVTARAAEADSCIHVYETVAVDATCTKGGYTAHTCTLCQDSYETDPVDPLGHDLQFQQAIAPTCTQEGLKAHYLCDRCQKLFWDEAGAEAVEDPAALEVAKLDHDYTYHHEVTPPTCLRGGYTRDYCQCGAYLTSEETEPVACAELELQPEQAATCTAEGVKAHYRCQLCQKIYWDGEGAQPAQAQELVLPVMPHSYGPWQTQIQPTPEEGGKQMRKCEHCEDTQYQDLDPLTQTLKQPALTVTISDDTGKPTLSWSKVSGAEAYRIYRQSGEEWVLWDTVSVLKKTDEEAMPGETYVYRVIAVNDTNCSAPSTGVSATCKCAKVSLSIQRDDPTGKPHISWTAVDGAVRYQIYRSKKSDTGFKTLVITEATDYLDTSAVAGEKYYYKIKVLCAVSAGNSTTSTPASHTCDCAQPVVKAKSGKTKGITLSWKKVSGAKKYVVYRWDSPDGTPTKLATVKTTAYTDASAPKHKVCYYTVRAYVSSTTSISAHSQMISITNHIFDSWKTVIPNTWEQKGRQERKCTACDEVESRTTPKLTRSLSTPKLKLSNHKTSGKPVLKWDKVKGATKYQVYVYDANTGKRVFLADTESCSYTYQAAVPGQTYVFTVLAQNSTQGSKFASAKNLLCKTETPSLRFEREEISGKPVVSWQASENAVSYRIYRSTSKKTGFRLLTQTEDLTVTVTDAVPGKTYYYKIQAIHENAAANSATGTAVCHVCDCPQVGAPVVRSADPKGLTITWKAVAGGKKYVVYRAVEENGTYKKVTTVSGTSYTDTTAPKNQMVHYKIRAYGSNSDSLSAYSPAGSGLNHTYSRWDVQKPNTWQQSGYRQRVCSGCGDVDGQDLPMLKLNLAIPKITVKTHSTSGKPVISWNSIRRATEYRIYRYDEETAEYTLVDYTDQRSYTYSQGVPGERYTFAVVAINKTECSAFSGKKTIRCRCATPSLDAGNDPDTGKPLLRWNAVEGAVKYEIYRSSRSSSGFKLYKTTEDTSLAINSATLGKTYYYKIKAIHGSSAAANSALGTAKKNICKLPRPVVTGGSVGSKCNLLSWDAVKNAQAYAVYRASSEKGTYQKIETVTKTRFLDYVSKGKTYFYKVVAEGEDSEINSARSKVVSSLETSPEKLKIYLSPSSQKANIYYKCGGTSEATQCRAISKYLETALERCGFAVKNNVKSDSMYYRVKESNEWGADLHMPLHTNAHDRYTTGTRIFYNYYKRTNCIDYKIGKAILKTLGPVTPGSPDLMLPGQLYEIGTSKAPTVYIEAEFHDNAKTAKWIVENKQAIAEAICEGLCNFYGVPYIPPETAQ